MGEYSQSLVMQASQAEILDYIADIRNLPKYLPTTKSAQPQGSDRVRVQGEVHEHRYDADGYLRCDRQAGRLEWGADEGYYSGSMEVRPDGGQDRARVTVRIVLGDVPGGPKGRMPSEQEVNEGLMASLESIRNEMEGRGGKVEPPAAT